MNHLYRCEYAAQVYELLAAYQVIDDLHYDGVGTVTAAAVQIRCRINGTEITFRNPYDNRLAATTLTVSQAPTTVVTIAEALLAECHPATRNNSFCQGCGTTTAVPVIDDAEPHLLSEVK